MNVKQWMKANSDMDRPWVSKAKCGWLLGLSWISDTTPQESELAHMRAVCDGCPVRTRCAAWATNANNGRGVDGGFYAGVWIPWATESDGIRVVRSRARRRLRELAGLVDSE